MNRRAFLSSLFVAAAARALPSLPYSAPPPASTSFSGAFVGVVRTTIRRGEYGWMQVAPSALYFLDPKEGPMMLVHNEEALWSVSKRAKP